MSPRYGNWPFQYPRSENYWAGRVPDGTDILITHAPPKAHLDDRHFGCDSLLRELWRVRPLLHVFGHVHEGYGTENVRFDNLQAAYEAVVRDRGGWGNLLKVTVEWLRAFWKPAGSARTVLVNASMMSSWRDRTLREPIVVEI